MTSPDAKMLKMPDAISKTAIWSPLNIVVQLCLWLEDGTLLYTNPAMEKATGYQRGELVGQNVLQLIHPDHHKGLMEFIQLRAEGLYFAPRSEIRLIRKDGSICWLDLVANWSDIDGVPTILGSALDITERKNIEQQLKNSEFYVEHINRTVPDLILVLDLEQRSVLYWSEPLSRS